MVLLSNHNLCFTFGPEITKLIFNNTCTFLSGVVALGHI